MRIGMYETSVKYLLSKNGEKLLIDFLQTEFISFYLLNIADLISVDPFGCQDSLFQYTWLLFSTHRKVIIALHWHLPWSLVPSRSSECVHNRISSNLLHIVLHCVLREWNQVPAMTIRMHPNIENTEFSDLQFNLPAPMFLANHSISSWSYSFYARISLNSEETISSKNHRKNVSPNRYTVLWRPLDDRLLSSLWILAPNWPLQLDYNRIRWKVHRAFDRIL